MNRKEKILLFLLAAINFTHILDFMIIMPLGNYLMPDFHITTQQFSLIVSSYSYAAFASGILAAFVIDNFDRKKSLLFGYTGFIIGTLFCGLAPDYNFSWRQGSWPDCLADSLAHRCFRLWQI